MGYWPNPALHGEKRDERSESCINGMIKTSAEVEQGLRTWA